MPISTRPRFTPLWREAGIGLEAAALARHPIYRRGPRPDVEPQAIMLVPGFLAGDRSLRMMAAWLRRGGHETCRAGMRSNVDCSGAAVLRLEDRLEEFAERSGRRVIIVGQSRGGLLARTMAVRRPDLVDSIVTLGSPHLGPMAVHPLVWAQGFALATAGSIGVRGLFSHSCRNGECCDDFRCGLEADFPTEVGFTSIYSRRDGIVDWRMCLDPGARHVEVRSSHCGMSMNAAVYEILDRELRTPAPRDELQDRRRVRTLPFRRRRAA